MNNKIIKILSEIRPDVNFNNNVDFIKNGMLDSLDIISLISELEHSFQISFSNEEIIPENFESIDAICRIINTKTL